MEEPLTMNNDNSVALLEMLNAREMRSVLQKQLLQQYRKPLICLTLNIPGPVKLLPGVPEAFAEGCRRIEETLQEHLILISNFRTEKEKTGYEAFYSVDASPEYVKELMTALEDQDALGRLFDIDVLNVNGTKISREELGQLARRCLICDEPAHACSRSRKHTVEELTARVSEILKPFTSC